MKSIFIRSSGRALGKDVITNAELKSIVTNFDISKVGTLDDWLKKHYDIKKRFWCVEGEHTSDLAFTAAKNCLEKAGTIAENIDFILLNTVFGDYQQPTTATLLQDKLGMP